VYSRKIRIFHLKMRLQANEISREQLSIMQ
jgi:hypothetical protein